MKKNKIALWKNLSRDIAFIAMTIFFVSGIILAVNAYNFVNNGDVNIFHSSDRFYAEHS